MLVEILVRSTGDGGEMALCQTLLYRSTSGAVRRASRANEKCRKIPRDFSAHFVSTVFDGRDCAIEGAETEVMRHPPRRGGKRRNTL